MNKVKALRVILIVAILVTSSVVFAQTPPNRTPPPPPGVPLDGGLFTLVAVAVGIAIKKLGFKTNK